MVKRLIVDEYNTVDVGGRGGVELGRKLISSLVLLLPTSGRHITAYYTQTINSTSLPSAKDPSNKKKAFKDT
ncbi:uncharacterized protein LAJ45_06019 [Morchella importuna]|uniref:uncharacterized protein n=1 Tax=Morchella importuna TaxID=1174673 RepID=UPI001E8ED09A|nr:uncharacterized protein LAJ45_06019 [Morchella importuna]KAH8149867.1 hypothetical protein LAJ45_06019 [Morchella importuna]